ncbi:hypothetical protein [Intestinimonas sp. HCP28S3_D6]|uniref:hypothetical protein n=1 Tax=Intestinimonas sp. HCP28S3_D6 TaxID=3438942 RepID=UPI003F89B319
MRLYSFPMKDAVNKEMETYINSFARVMNFCHQTEQLILPVPKNIPAWFAEAEQTTSLAKSNALLWKNSVGGNLLHMPEALLAYQPVYQSKAQTVQNLFQILADHPEDQNSRALAAQHLADLHTVLLSQKNAIQSQTNPLTKCFNI